MIKSDKELEEFVDYYIACCSKLAIYNAENGGTPSSDHAITQEFRKAQDEYLKRKLERK